MTTTTAAPTAQAGVLTAERARALLEQMILTRRFEARAAELYTKEKIRGFLHLYDGEEAIAVGFGRALQPQDAIVATYREHGQALARGIPASALMAELYGKVDGSSRGRGGSMHVFDVARRFYGGNAIVGAGVPLAVGLALADKVLGTNNVTAAFFGEGACDEGTFWESVNLAALWQVPVLFVCENNRYSMGMAFERAQASQDLVKKVSAFGVEALNVDGMDALALDDAAPALVDKVRKGAPLFVECRTYRFRAHSMFDAQLYRDKTEVETWKRERDPITLFEAKARAAGVLDDEALRAIEATVERVLDDAVAFAEQSQREPLADLEVDVVAGRPQ